MKVYLDVHRKKGIKYVEDYYSSSEIIDMNPEEFRNMIKSFGDEIHSCYSTFINHVGRFHRDLGSGWFGEPLQIFANENACETGKVIEYKFKDNGQIEHFPYAYFD